MMKRKYLALLLSIVLTLSLVPTSAFAAASATIGKGEAEISISATEPDANGGIKVVLNVTPGENNYLTGYTFAVQYDPSMVVPDMDAEGAISKTKAGVTTYYGVSLSGIKDTAFFISKSFVDAGRSIFLATDVNPDTFYGEVAPFSVTFYFEQTEAAKKNGGKADFKLLSGEASGTSLFEITVFGNDSSINDLSDIVSTSLAFPMKSVALTGGVTTPTKGETDASNVTSSNVDAQVSWSPALEDGKFAANTDYTATVRVTPQEGYLFAENVAFTGLDGYTFAKQDDGSYQASKKYEKTADKDLTGLEITTPPTKTEYVHGDAFDPAGMVVKATYDDDSVDNAFTGYTVEKSVVKHGDTAVTLKSGALTATQSITVNQKELTITGLKASDREFDGTVDVAVTGGKLVGVLAGEEVTAKMPTGGKMADAKVGTNKNVSGLSATLEGTDAANYTLAKIDDIQVNITPKSVAAEWTAEENYTYTGAELTAPTAAYTAVDSSKVACEVTCDKPFKDVGEYTFTAATKDANYTLTNSTKTVTVNKAAITDVAVTQTGELTYNGEAQIANVRTTAVTKGSVSVAFTYSAAENGTYAAAVPAFTDAGTYTVYYKADAENHETVAGSFTVTIDKAAASGITGEVSLYHADTTTGTFEASALKNVPTAGWTDVKFESVGAMSGDGVLSAAPTLADGKLSYAPTGTAGVGKTATVTATVSSKNYENATVTLTFKTVDINIDWTAIGKDNIALKSAPVYGDKNSDILTVKNADYTAQTTGKVPGRLSVKEADSYPAAGTTSVTLVFTPDANSGISGIFTHSYPITAVAQKAITVTADAKKAVYGDALPEFTFTVPAGALVGSDTAESLGVTLASSAVKGSDAGVYGITKSACSAANYEVTVEGAGKLTITPKPLTAVISGTVSKDYDGKNEVKTPVSVTLSGIYNTDDVTAVVKSAVFTGVNAGEQKVRVQIELDGAKKGNYTLAESTIEANGTINKAAHSAISVNDLKAKYGNTATLNLKALNLPEGYTFGTIDTTDNDKIFAAAPAIEGNTLRVKLAADKAKVGETGTITIPVSSTNYQKFNLIVTVTVLDKTAQTLTAEAIDTVYGESFTPNVSGAKTDLTYKVKSGSIEYKNGKFTATGIGAAVITATAAETEEYAPAVLEIPVNIAKRTLTVKAADKSAYIGEKLPELTYTVSGLVGNDKLTPVPTLKLVHDANVDPMKQAGTYVIGFETEPAASANYELSAQTGTLTVSARPSCVGPTGNAVSVDRTENGKISVSPSYAAKGATVTITVTPDKDQELKSLEVIDQNGNSLPLTDLGNGKFSFVMPEGKVTIKSEFGEANAFVNPYDDVKPGDWYYSAVEYVTVNGLMNGTGKGFEPNLATSRAMIWTILARMSDVNTASSGEWYAVAQQWAIANGVSDGTMPNGTITREQLAAMLYRYAVSKGMVKGPATADLSVFADANSVSNYAVEAMRWAVSTGLIGGMDGKLNPQGSATRAQVATMLMRFAELAK